MIPSNILGVLNPPKEAKDISNEEMCLGCQILGSFTCMAGGLYFMSNVPFKGTNASAKRNPPWWKVSVKSAGAGLFALGVYRAGEGWMWNKDITYKEKLF